VGVAFDIKSNVNKLESFKAVNDVSNELRHAGKPIELWFMTLRFGAQLQLFRRAEIEIEV
jgi:hypothetical protein